MAMVGWCEHIPLGEGLGQANDHPHQFEQVGCRHTACLATSLLQNERPPLVAFTMVSCDLLRLWSALPSDGLQGSPAILKLLRMISISNNLKPQILVSNSISNLKSLWSVSQILVSIRHIRAKIGSLVSPRFARVPREGGRVLRWESVW